MVQGSTALIIGGLWLAVLGYGVLFTGVAKIGGDSTYHLAQAFRGEAPSGSSSPQQSGGASARDARNAAGYQQASMIPMVPLT